MDLPPDVDARPLTLYKRWTLRESASVEAVRGLVEREIVPAYRRLSADVELGFEVVVNGTDGDVDGTDSILAVQRWKSLAAHADAMSGEAFDRWWSGYEPVLAEWDRLVVFVDEWSTVPVPLN